MAKLTKHRHKRVKSLEGVVRTTVDLSCGKMLEVMYQEEEAPEDDEIDALTIATVDKSDPECALSHLMPWLVRPVEQEMDRVRTCTEGMAFFGGAICVRNIVWIVFMVIG